jgi:hypothetical protein
MEVINGVEYYDEPDVYPADYAEWEKNWCNNCKYDYKGPTLDCNVMFEVAINGWSRAYVRNGNDVECTDFERIDNG